MSHFIKISVLVLVFTGLLAGSFDTTFAGAWVQNKRGYFFKLSGHYLYSTQEFNADGDLQDIREPETTITETSYQDVGLTGYLEYGISNRLTMVANLPFKILTSKRTELASPGSPTRKVEVVTGGLADLTLSGRFLLIGGGTPISIQAGAKIPMGYDASPPDEGAPLGSGKVDLEGHVLAGTSLYPVPAYITAQFGYRYRNGTGIADEYLFQAEIGLTPGRLLVKLTVDGLYSAETPDDKGSATTTVTNQDVVKLIPTIAYGFTPWFSIGAEVFHTISGKNIVAGTTYVAGVVFTR